MQCMCCCCCRRHEVAFSSSPAQRSPAHGARLYQRLPPVVGPSTRKKYHGLMVGRNTVAGARSSFVCASLDPRHPSPTSSRVLPTSDNQAAPIPLDPTEHVQARLCPAAGRHKAAGTSERTRCCRHVPPYPPPVEQRSHLRQVVLPSSSSHVCPSASKGSGGPGSPGPPWERVLDGCAHGVGDGAEVPRCCCCRRRRSPTLSAFRA
jgi:hypothetical protein